MFHKKELLYGCDYNPEQWKNYPSILEDDIRLMKEANCNVVSLGIFAWSELEPEEGQYTFSFLDQIIDRLEENNISIILATPSGARPAWMAEKYPEILRTDEYGIKHQFGKRHNHCFTSPVYRTKVRQLNEQLAKHYGHRKSILAWHVSNEYSGECKCALCAKAFRNWLKEKYHNNLSLLNEQWWNSFWGHTITSWEQINPPSVIGENSVHGLCIDWKRFVTYQTRDFYRNEIEPLKRITPHIPVTTNFHGDLTDLNYWEFSRDIDIACWDIYPFWHKEKNLAKTACSTAFVFDICRSLKGNQPFLLMESTPSNVNWAPICNLKRPGINELTSLQAISCGSDSVQYFQWRKSRGSEEKFHGAVVDHYGKSDTRVFKEVAQLGHILKNISELSDSVVNSKIAIIYDWENCWGLQYSAGFHNDHKGYLDECLAHYRYFWENGYNVDVINVKHDFAKYDILIAPMLYMIPEATINHLKEYVNNGGTLVSGYMTGYVNENDLCYLGGFPGNDLKEIFGIWDEEIDCLYADETNHIEYQGEIYPVKDYFETIHLQGAEAIGTYTDSYVKDRPAIAVHSYGKGNAYYMAFKSDERFLHDFYKTLLPPCYQLPEGVSLRTRESDTCKYVILQNWNAETMAINVPFAAHDLIHNSPIEGLVQISGYETLILKQEK